MDRILFDGNLPWHLITDYAIIDHGIVRNEPMMSLNISLPETMRAFIDEQVKTGGYGTASEYLRGLIREDQKRKSQEKLETLLVEGLASGIPTELTSEDWEYIRHEVKRRACERKTT